MQWQSYGGNHAVAIVVATELYSKHTDTVTLLFLVFQRANPLDYVPTPFDHYQRLL